MSFTPEKLREIADRPHVPADAQEALQAAATALENWQRAHDQTILVERMQRQWADMRPAQHVPSMSGRLYENHPTTDYARLDNDYKRWLNAQGNQNVG